MRQQYGRDSDVVVDDVTLLEASFRVKNLLEVRHVDDSPFYIEPRCCGHIGMTSRERSRLCLRADLCLREIEVSVMARTISTIASTDQSRKRKLQPLHAWPTKDAKAGAFA